VYVKHKLVFKNNVYSDPIESVVDEGIPTSLPSSIIATSILLRLNIPLCFNLEYFPFTTLLRSCDFYSEDQV
jgi:hypothetical protein